METCLRSSIRHVLRRNTKRIYLQWKNTHQSHLRSLLKFNADDYVFISSFTHHPFYDEFIIEVPDNWMMKEVYNVPMNEMMEVIDHALMNDYSLAWASDVSEEGFSFRQGMALVPLDGAKKKKSGKDNKL